MIRGVLPCGQFHDEFIATLPEGQEKDYEEVLTWAIAKTNDKLKLNVELGIDIQFGTRYSEIH
jgi:DNA polymerase I-like protein with 3'-5' exonuclease and polymerase domains